MSDIGSANDKPSESAQQIPCDVADCLEPPCEQSIVAEACMCLGHWQEFLASARRVTKGGYRSGGTPVSELKPPPKGVGAGVRRRGGTYLNPSSDWYGE